MSPRRLSPRVPHSLLIQRFLPSSLLTRTSVPLRLQTIWSPSVRANAATWTTAFHWRLQMRRSCWARLTNLPPVVYTAQSSQLMAKLICILSNAVEELGFEWSTPEEPPLFEWFLLGRRQAPRQRASPFFPEVHDEITKSWR